MALWHTHGGRTGRATRRAAPVAVALAAVCLLAGPGPSAAGAATVYYQHAGSVDRLELNGSPPAPASAGPGVPAVALRIAVSGQYMYWDTDTTTHGVILRTPLAGGRSRVLVRTPVLGTAGPVIAAGHIYWAEQHALARAELNGSHVQRDFVKLPEEAPGFGVTQGLATAGRYVYFTRCDEHEIGRVAVNGSGANPDFLDAFPSCPQSLAVADGHVYWGSVSLDGPGAIGRVALNGTAEQPRWLVMPGSPAGGPWDLAVAGPDLLYSWGGTPESAPSFIGRVGLDGTQPEPQLIAQAGPALTVVG